MTTIHRGKVVGFLVIMSLAIGRLLQRLVFVEESCIWAYILPIFLVRVVLRF